MTGGVPQGSVLGLLLWNFMYNGLLNLNLLTAGNLEQASIIADACTGAVKKCLLKLGLTLADHKTEAILVYSRKKKNL